MVLGGMAIASAHQSAISAHKYEMATFLFFNFAICIPLVDSIISILLGNLGDSSKSTNIYLKFQI